MTGAAAAGDSTFERAAAGTPLRRSPAAPDGESRKDTVALNSKKERVFIAGYPAR